jgi:hypothetical protein
MGKGMRSRTPLTRGGPAVIIAIDDEVLEAAPEIERIVAALGTDVPYEVVRASELASPDTDADFWLGAAPERRAGFTLLCVTHAQQVFEQNDSTGAIYRDRAEVWPDAPIAMATPALAIVGELRLLHDGALLFRTGDRVRVTGIPMITGLFAQPILKSDDGRSEARWLEAAARALGPEMR